MRITRGNDASNGLNGFASHPKKPHTTVVRSRPRAAVVEPPSVTFKENGSWGGFGAKNILGSTTFARNPGALDITW